MTYKHCSRLHTLDEKIKTQSGYIIM